MGALFRMNWQSRVIGAAALVALLPAVALAQQGEPSRGFYVGAGGGLNLMGKKDVDGPGVSGQIDPGTGWAATVSAGYKFGGPRVELEGGYRENKADSCPVAGCDGRYQTWSAMGNALYDFRTGWGVTPYVGVGVGAARTDIKGLGNNWVFAYQGIAGVTYQVNPSLDVFADYRYFGTEDVKVDGDVDVENNGHTGILGVRWTFAAPMKAAEPPMAAPPPPPLEEPYVQAPAPAPAAPPPIVRSYLVFFEFNRADLTNDAQRIVETAARNATTADVTRIDVTGHADRAGPTRYNQRLSMQRAESVRSELIRNGVPQSEIAIFAKGETEPLIPTRDGVREAQNRRVEIVLQ